MFGRSSDDSHWENNSSSNSPLLQTPYLNIDPSYLRGEDDYILLEDASPVRSRAQVMFSVVGSATVLGATIGGLGSMRYTGLQLLKGKSERMQTTSAVLKNGGRIASKFGSIAVLYYSCSIICEKVRGEEDVINTLVGGAAAGALYSIPGVLNVKKHGRLPVEEIEKLGFLKRNFMRLPPVGRFFFSAGLGLATGGLLCLYKDQASNYIRNITSRD